MTIKVEDCEVFVLVMRFGSVKSSLELKDQAISGLTGPVFTTARRELASFLIMEAISLVLRQI